MLSKRTKQESTQLFDPLANFFSAFFSARRRLKNAESIALHSAASSPEFTVIW
jgi:hypothetical protein